jgi:hypothetical protein
MLSFITLIGCTRSTPPEIDLTLIEQALQRTSNTPAPEPHSDIEATAFKRFAHFYTEYSADRITSNVQNLYAEDAFFADPYHLVQGIDAIEDYFIAMAAPAQSCTFDIGTIQRAENDFYCRWTMHLISNAAPDQPIIAQGLTHMRFNTVGKIIFHQDYWDTSLLLDRLPVVGFWTKLVKNRILKGMNHE